MTRIRESNRQTPRVQPSGPASPTFGAGVHVGLARRERWTRGLGAS
jgi:hypothetical protein